MSKNMRKALSLILVACMVFTLAACNSSNGGSTTAGTTAAGTTAAGATTAPAEKEHITIDWVGAEYGPVDEGAPITKLVEEKFNVTINPIYIEAANKIELFNLKFASGDIPDVFNINAMSAFREWASQDLLAEVSPDFVKEHAPSIYNELAGWEEELGYAIWPHTEVDGAYYGIPTINSDNTYPGVMVWNKTWLDNVGITKVPETLDEFKTAFYAFTNDDPDGNGKKDTYGFSKEGLEAIYGTSGFYPSDWAYAKDNSVVYGGIQPEMKEVLTLLNQWYKDGVLDPEFVTGENTGGYWAISHAFDNGRIGFTGMGNYYHWNYPLYTGDTGGSNYAVFKENQGEDHDYVLGVPATKDGVGGRHCGRITSTACMFGSQVGDDLPKYARILEIMDLAASDYEYYMTVKNGIEGEHWNYDDNGNVVKIESLGSLEGQSAIGTSNMYMPWQSARMYQKSREALTKFADETVGKYRDTSYLDVKMVTLPSEPDYLAELDTLRTTTFTKMITGEQSLDTWDQYVADWLSRGGQTLTDEMNETYKK